MNWFISYFNQRKKVVWINEIGWRHWIYYRAVRGSTRSPLLFLIYINNINMTKLSITGKPFLFDDDTALSTGCTWNDEYAQASLNLAKLKSWFDHDTLTINIEKTNFMTICYRTNRDPVLEGCGYTPVGSQGRLHVEVEIFSVWSISRTVIDQKLSWAPHVYYLNQRLVCFFTSQAGFVSG